MIFVELIILIALIGYAYSCRMYCKKIEYMYQRSMYQRSMSYDEYNRHKVEGLEAKMHELYIFAHQSLGDYK